MKKLLISLVTITFGLAVCSAMEYSRESLMGKLKTIESAEAADGIFTDFVQKTPDLEFAYEINKMWAGNNPDSAQRCLDGMRTDPAFSGRVIYFEGAGIENLSERIDFCRKQIEKDPETFEAYALMFDTYTSWIFKKSLDASPDPAKEGVKPNDIEKLEKDFPADNKKMVQIRKWKESGQHTEAALKYMGYYGVFKKHYDDAFKYFTEGEALGADWVDYSHIAVMAVRLKRIDTAKEYIKKYVDTWIQRGAISEDRRSNMMESVTMYALVNGAAYDEAISDIVSRDGAMEDRGTVYNLACLYSRKGDIDKAFETLNSAIDKGYNNVTEIENDTDLVPLHEDARWIQIIKKAKSAWEKGESSRKLEAIAQKIEKDAPEWVLSDPSGKQYKLSDYIGKKVVILDFWATWCGPCMMAMPKLSQWTMKDKPEPVEVFSINTWERQPEKAKALFTDKKFAMTLLLAGDETGKAYGVQGIPYICVIDKKGKIRYEMKGFSADLEQNLSYWVEDLLK